jgi:hypothetical protein
MDADGIVFLEGFTQGVNRHQADIGGIQCIDAHMRRPARMRSLPDVADGLHHTPIVGYCHAGELILRSGAGVDHHGHVHVIEMPEAEQFRLPSQKLKLRHTPRLARRRPPPGRRDAAGRYCRAGL